MILSRLKTETRESHLRVENDLAVMRPDLTIDHYGRVLARLHAFFAAWEPRVGALLDDEGFFGPRRKVGLLDRDLEALGIRRPEPVDSTVLPVLTNRLEALGSLYVLEGSTLGGQYIAKHAEQTLGLARGKGSAYFRSYGKAVAEHWRSFQQALEAVSSPVSDDVVVAAAQSTFDRLHQWLCQVPPLPQGARRHG
jgi:heme oxygenase